MNTDAAVCFGMFEKLRAEEGIRGAALGVPPHCAKMWRNISDY